MKPVAWLVIGCALTGGCFREGLAPPDEAAAYPAAVQPGSALAHDIEAGYRAYGAMLAPLGEWSSDAAYGVKWCPRVDPAAFTPYRSRGHWVAGESPDAPPAWQSDDPAAWTDVTTHHGWWVYDEPKSAPSRWCWVPGAEATAGRVIWRTGDGFVGWAPEPPPTDPDDEGGGDDDDLAWSFELEGTLYDDPVDDALLDDSGADSAYAATHGPHAHRSRTGPARGEVAGARRALGDYFVAHPEVGASSRTTLHAPGDRPLPPGRTMLQHLAREGETSSARRWGAGGSGGSSGLPRIPAETLHRSTDVRASGASGGSAGHGGASVYHPSESGGSSHAWGGGHEQVAQNHPSGGSTSSFGGSGHSAASHSSHGGTSSAGGGGGGGCGSAHSAAGHRN